MPPAAAQPAGCSGGGTRPPRANQPAAPPREQPMATARHPSRRSAGRRRAGPGAHVNRGATCLGELLKGPRAVVRKKGGARGGGQPRWGGQSRPCFYSRCHEAPFHEEPRLRARHAAPAGRAARSSRQAAPPPAPLWWYGLSCPRRRRTLRLWGGAWRSPPVKHGAPGGSMAVSGVVFCLLRLASAQLRTLSGAALARWQRGVGTDRRSA